MIAAPTLPPEDRKPMRIGGVVQGAFTTILPQKPMLVRKYATMLDAAGASMNGIARIGFITMGRPNTSGSLMLKIAQGISSFAMAL